MYTVRYTAGDLLQLSNRKFVVTSDHAIMPTMDDAKRHIILICQKLRISPNDFTVTTPEGKTLRMRHAAPEAFTRTR